MLTTFCISQDVSKYCEVGHEVLDVNRMCCHLAESVRGLNIVLEVGRGCQLGVMSASLATCFNGPSAITTFTLSE